MFITEHFYLLHLCTSQKEKNKLRPLKKKKKVSTSRDFVMQFIPPYIHIVFLKIPTPTRPILAAEFKSNPNPIRLSVSNALEDLNYLVQFV